jgi:hypothetical protein
LASFWRTRQKIILFFGAAFGKRLFKVINVNKLALATLIFLGFLCFSPFSGTALAQKEQALALPLPERTGGMPLNEAINLRRSQRSFLPEELELTQLSQLLWSAFGITREAGKMRAIPTAHNRQNLRVFAVLKSGVWLYEAEKNQLTLQLSGNFLEEFGEAPLTLMYAVPTSDGAVGGVHVGLAAQDVGLTCASLGLANVLKTTGANALNGKLPLPTGYQVVAVHSVGRPNGAQ